MPQRDRLGADQIERVERVAVAVAAREDDDADAGRHQATAPIDSMAYASMSWFASNSEASRSTTTRAADSSAASTVSSTRRPTRTERDAVDAEMSEAPLDGAPLRVEDARLGRHVHGEPVAAHRAMTSSLRYRSKLAPVTRSKAST